MNEFHVAMCDEDTELLIAQIQVIEPLFSKENVVCRIEAFPSSKELFDRLDQTEYDMVFLDIDMPEITGFDLAEKASSRYPKMLIIFVTSHDELVFPTFRYHPFRFIRKSHFAEEIPEAVHEAVRSIMERNRILEIQTAEGLQYVYASEILFVESEKNYLSIITKHGILRCRDTLSHKEKEWGGYGFIRTHSGFLVNQRYIYSIEAESVRLRSGKYKEIPLSKRRREAVIEAFKKHIRS